MANEQNLKPFKKGDPRINRKGRPKTFDALRKLIQTVGNEIATDKDGKVILNPATGKPFTRIELAIRAMMSNPRQLRTLLAYGYGMPPQRLEHSGPEGGDIPVAWTDHTVDYRKGLNGIDSESEATND